MQKCCKPATIPPPSPLFPSPYHIPPNHKLQRQVELFFLVFFNFVREWQVQVAFAYSLEIVPLFSFKIK